MGTTNRDAQFYLCETPQSSDLTQAQFEQLVMTRIEKVVTAPDMGTNDNIVSQATHDTAVTTKAKGIADAGDGELVLEYAGAYAGQEALETAAGTNYTYAVCRVLSDAPDTSSTNTAIWGRAKLGGPVMSGGDNESFVNDTFAISFTDQKTIRVRPTTGAAPTNITVPTITGTATVGETLTASKGVFQSANPDVVYTYQWQADASDITDATESTYVLTGSESGEVITVIVTATNSFGGTDATSAATDAVAGS